MAYNNGREDRKWRIWKEAEEKVEYYGAAEPPVRCGEVLPQLPVFCFQ